MAALTPDVHVGYLEAGDVYVAFSEYYGDGTIYGYCPLIAPDGGFFHGAGKTVTELIALGATLYPEPGTVPGELVVVPLGDEPALAAGAAVACASESASHKVVVTLGGFTASCVTQGANVSAVVDEASGTVTFEVKQ